VNTFSLEAYRDEIDRKNREDEMEMMFLFWSRERLTKGAKVLDEV